MRRDIVLSIYPYQFQIGTPVGHPTIRFHFNSCRSGTISFASSVRELQFIDRVLNLGNIMKNNFYELFLHHATITNYE